MSKHLSYSEFKDWVFCPFYHKLVYIDDLFSFEGNEFTAFGKALHTICEGKVIEKTLKKNDANWEEIFEKTLTKEVDELRKKQIKIDEALYNDMKLQGKVILPYILPAMNEYFGNDWELVAVEQLFKEPILYFETDYKFKGFIDLIVKTPDGKYHIVDHKSTSWGWDGRKKGDKMINYQLTLYKYFYAQKAKIDLKNIETHFCLLKRTAKKNNVEFFRVSSGDKKINNVLDLVKKAVYNIESSNFTKNRFNCEKCSVGKLKCGMM